LQRNVKTKKTGALRFKASYEAYKMSKGGAGSWENVEVLDCVLVFLLAFSAAMGERERERERIVWVFEDFDLLCFALLC
jgi:hypothetical protein